MNNIDIIIINWNSGEQTLKCIESIQLNSQDTVNEIIVIDNNSTDNSQLLISNTEGIQFIQSNSNLGFAKACNLGAQKSKSTFLLFLNPDTILYEKTLSNVLHFMLAKESDSIGICGIQLLDENKTLSRTCSYFPNSWTMLLYTLGLSKIFTQFNYHMTDWNHSESKEVDHVIGAFFLVRKSLFDRLNGFDERFFMYLEDLDFSLRAFRAGYTSYYLSTVQAFHKGGGTSEQVKAKRLFYSIRSRILYSYKHFSFIPATVILLASLLIEPWTRLLFILIKQNYSSIKELIEAYLLIYEWLFDIGFKKKN
jgi:N-acetylglucosaminyl-diphospho-decaprenol L-rhamnosyltransferase